MTNKIWLIFIIVSVFIGKNGLTQTLYVPSGAEGIDEVINGSTNVGVGTNSPTDIFQIDAPHSQVRLRDTDDGKFVQFSYSSGFLAIRNNSTSSHHFFLTENGYVGIGKIDPQDNIDLKGRLRITSSRTSKPEDFAQIYPTYGIDQTNYSDQTNDKWERALMIKAYGYVDTQLSGGCGIQFWTNDKTGIKQSMVIRRDGRVGIGTINPENALHVKSNTFGWTAKFSGPDGYILLGPENPGWAHIYTDRPKFIFNKDLYTSTGGVSSYNSGSLYLKTNGTTRLTVQNGGNIGIGTSAPVYKLDVLGTIRANEVKVTSSGADFVFESDYDLLSLDEVESYIKQNGHLPDIPSAEVVKADGISLGEMNTKLLQKIEELTLYMIELKKENENQAKEINELKTKLLKQ